MLLLCAPYIIHVCVHADNGCVLRLGRRGANVWVVGSAKAAPCVRACRWAAGGRAMCVRAHIQQLHLSPRHRASVSSLSRA